MISRSKMDERNHMVVDLRDQGLTLRAIADMAEISVERVRQICGKAARARAFKADVMARADYQVIAECVSAGRRIPDDVSLDSLAKYIHYQDEGRWTEALCVWAARDLESPPYNEWRRDPLPSIRTAGDLREVGVRRVLNKYPNIGRKRIMPMAELLGMTDAPQ